MRGVISSPAQRSPSLKTRRTMSCSEALEDAGLSALLDEGFDFFLGDGGFLGSLDSEQADDELGRAAEQA